MNIVQAFQDPRLLGPHFAGPNWANWMTVQKALFGLPMTPGEATVCARLTGRSALAKTPFSEAWLVVGRRAGKTRMLSGTAVYLACFIDWRPFLAPGERATVMVIAADRRQARVLFRYALALLQGTPMLAALIDKPNAETIILTNGVAIEIHTANFRSVRGYTIVAALLDEVAFWRDESSANPDREIVDALRPAMATVPGAKLIGASSPYRRSGVLWDAYDRSWGRDDDPVLIVHAPSRLMNPTLPQSVVHAAYRRDPVAAAAEFGAEFRSDISGFLDEAAIRAAVDEGCHERAPQTATAYAAFCDPSGGRGDAFTLAVAHADDEIAVLDCLRRIPPPFDPAKVVVEMAGVLRRYGIAEVVGDRYAGEWVSRAFQANGITYALSVRSKADIYLEVQPLFATGQARILDDAVLLTELRQLERRVRPGGRDMVDHPPRGHDDAANAACGALLLAGRRAMEDWGAEKFGASEPLASFSEWERAREEEGFSLKGAGP